MTEPSPPWVNQEVSDAVVFGDVVQLGHVEGDVTIVRELPAYRLELAALSPPDEAHRAEEVPTHRRAPSYLLDAARQVVPFRGREAELKDLILWRDSPPHCAVRLLSGPGGQGKSRLATEFARRCQQAGWIVLTAVERADTHISPTKLGSASSGPWPNDTQAPVLVLVDYADRWRLDPLIDLLRDLEHRSTQRRVRVLLLARDGPALWESVVSELDRGTADLGEPMLLGGLDPSDSRRLSFEQATEAFRSALEAGDDRIDPPTDLAHPDYGSPLNLHMAALAAVYSLIEGTTPPTRGDLSVFLLRRERRYWQRTYRAVITDGRTQPVSVDTVARTVFLATLFGPLPTETGQAALLRAALADSNAQAHSIVVFHRRFYPAHSPSEVLVPLRPDRFGEDYIAHVLDSEDGEGVWRIASDLASTAIGVMEEPGTVSQPVLVGALAGRQCLAVLAAASEDDRHPHLRSRLFAILESTPRLAYCISAPVLRVLNRVGPPELLTRIQDKLPFSAEILHETVELAFRLLHDLSPDAPLAVRALHFAYVRDALGHVGDWRGALAYAEEAASLYRNLAETDASKNLPELAASLLALGAALHNAGEERKALLATRDAVDTYRRLAEAQNIGSVSFKHASHIPALAAALGNYSVRLGNAGDHEGALDVSREAVSALRALDSIKPGVYRSQFGMSLNNLGFCLGNLSRGKEAVKACQEAVGIFRSLAEGRPEAYLPNLGLTLNNLAARLAAIGDARSALPSIEEAHAIFRDLADQYPAAYLFDLVRTLDNLKLRYEELGESHAALEAARKAVVAIRPLVAIDASMYSSALASLLHKLGMQAKRAGDLPAAAAAMQECVELRRSLAKTDPTILPNLAAALRDLGAILWNASNRKEAVAAAEEAVQVFRQVTSVDSRPYLLLHFARCLDNYYAMLAATGDLPPRRNIAEELVAAYRRVVRDDSSHLSSLAKALVELSYEIAKLTRYSSSPVAGGSSNEATLALVEEAVTIYRGLPSPEPGRLADFAHALFGLSAARFATGAKRPALQAIEECVDVYRQLAQRDRAYCTKLATALTSLAALQSNVGERREAVASAREAVGAYERLTANESVHLPQLARSFEHYRKMLRAAGQVGDPAILPEARMAVDAYRQLSTSEPATYRPHLAIWLCHLVVPLLKTGGKDAALAAYKEAFAIYKELAQVDQMVTNPSVAEVALDLATLSLSLRATSVGPTLGREAVKRYQALSKRSPVVYQAELGTAYCAFAMTCKEAGLLPEAGAAAELAIETFDQLGAARAQQYRKQREMAQQTLDDIRRAP